MANLTLQVDAKKRIREEIRYAPLTEADLNEMSGLIRGMQPYSPDRVRLRDFSPEYYHWMFFRNPAGPAFVHTARHRGDMTGNLSGFVKVHITAQNRYFFPGFRTDFLPYPVNAHINYAGTRLNPLRLDQSRYAGRHN